MKHARTLVKIARAAGVVALAGLADCLDDGTRYECHSESTCLATAVLESGETVHTFQGDCIGERCEVVPTTGVASFGESFHPALRALHLPAGSGALVHVAVRGNGDGVVIAANVRCTDGASLVVHDDVSGAGPAVFAGPSAWRRVDWTMAVATCSGCGDARSAYVSLAVVGGGECAVDRLRFIRTALVCVRSETHTVCTAVYDAGPGGEDAGEQDASSFDAPSRDAGADEEDAGQRDDLAPDDIPRQARDAGVGDVRLVDLGEPSDGAMDADALVDAPFGG